MKDTVRPTNEVVGDEAAPVPAEQPAWRRTMMLRVKGRLGDIIGQLTAAGALIVVFIFLTFASPDFLTANNLINIIEQNAVTAVIALGMTFVIITAGIDLSVGSTAAMTGVLGVVLIADGMNWPLALLIAILAGGVVGLGKGDGSSTPQWDAGSERGYGCHSRHQGKL